MADDQPDVFKQASPLDDIGDVGPPIGQDTSKSFGTGSGPTVLNTVTDSFAPQGAGTGASALGTALQETGPARFATPLDDIGEIAPSDVSTAGAAARGAVHGALPAVGAMAGAGAGAEAGAAGGALVAPFLGPFAPAGPLLGGLAGGIAGAIGGGMAAEKAQDYTLSKLPDSVVDAFGQGDRQQQLDQQYKGGAYWSGGMLPFALTMQPTKLLASAAALPEGATALQRLMANPVTARLFGGGVMGGMELGQEAVQGQVDWRKVGIATGFGIVFNKPNALGEAITEMGAAPARRLLGRQVVDQAPPTIAQAADTKIMGPGITEAVFQGSHEQAPEAAMAAQQTARDERAAQGDHPEPNPTDIARQMEPELFARYDDLVNRRDQFRKWIDEYNRPSPETITAADQKISDIQKQLDDHVAERGGYAAGPEARRLRAQIREAQGERADLTSRAEAFTRGEAQDTADVALARKHLADTDFELRDVQRDVAAAHRRAADAAGAETVPAEPHATIGDMLAEQERGPNAQAPGTEPGAIGVPPSGEAGAQAAGPGGTAGPVAPGPQRSIGDQRAFIADDAARRLIAAGRPEDEARATGHVVAARYVTRAGRFDGKLGSAEELYAKDGAAIAGPNGKALAPGSDAAKPSMPDDRIQAISDRIEQIQNLPDEMYTDDIGRERDGLYRQLAAAKAEKNLSQVVPGSTSRVDDMGNVDPDTFHFPISDASGKKIGHIEYVMGSRTGDGHALTIRAAGIDDPSSRGFGYGQQAYKKVVDWALGKGLDVYSSGDTNNFSSKVYERFKAQGYEVTKDQGTYKISAARATAPRDAYEAAGSAQSEAHTAAAQPARELAAKPPTEPGILAHDFDTADRIKNEWRKITPFTGSTDDFIAASKPNQEALVSVSKHLADELGLDFRDPGIKADGPGEGRDRLESKAQRFGAIGSVTDQVRAGFNVDTPAQADQIVQRMGEKFQVTDEGWNITPAGYFDRKVYVRFPDGMIGEVQIWPPGMLHAKSQKGGRGHILYEGVRDLPPWHPLIPEFNRTQEAVYGPVRAALSDEWNAALGKGGSEPNRLPNAAAESTAALEPTSAALTSDHEPLTSAQASEGVQKAGSPSQEQALMSDMFGISNKNVEGREPAVNGQNGKELAQRDFYSAADFEGYPVGKGEISHDLRDEWAEQAKDLKEDGEEMPESPAMRLALKKFDDLIKHNDAGHVIMPDQIPDVISALGKAKADIADKFETGGGKTTARALSGRVLESSIDNEITGLRKTEKELHDFFSAEDQKELSQTANASIRPASWWGWNPQPFDRSLIKFFKSANASSGIHEFSHGWLEEMRKDSAHPEAPQGLRDDMQTVNDWLGVGENGEIKTKQHEKFARGFEQYMREGVAPSKELAGVFAQFRNWLLQIYQSLKGLGTTEISPEMRNVFDRMLEMEPQRTVIAPERLQPDLLHDIHEADAAHTSPHEAEPAMDRIIAERDRYITEQPPEIQRELEAAAQKVQAAQGPAGEAAGAPGEAFASPGGPGQMGEGGGGPGPEPGGGGGGAEHGAQQPGGGGAGAESNARPDPRSQLDRDPGTALAPGPAQSLGRRSSPFTDKAGNIRLENLTNIADVRQAIHDAADENNDFIGDRRGVVTDGQVSDLANDIGLPGAMDMVSKWVKGQAYNAEQVVVLRRLLRSSAIDLSEKMKQAAIGTDEDVMAYAEARDRHQLIQRTVAGATAEAGRALRAFRNIAGEEGSAAKALNEMVKIGTGKTLFQLKAEAKLGAKLDTPEKISRFMQDAQKRNFGRGVLEYFVNALISGPITHITYGVGNEVSSILRAGPETLAAAAIGHVRKALGREGEVVHAGEALAQYRARYGTIPASIQSAMEAARTGMTTLLPGEEIAPGHGALTPFEGDTNLATAKSMTNEPVSWNDAMGSAFGAVRSIKDAFWVGGTLNDRPIGLEYSPLGQIPDVRVGSVNIPIGTAVRLPGRLVAAEHSFFRTANYAMERSREAFRIATDEGLTGAARNQRIAEIELNPSQEQMDRWIQASTHATLMGQGGAFVRKLSAMINHEFNVPGIGPTPMLKFMDPFIKISGNIIEQSLIQRTPIGLLSQELRADLMGKNGNIAQDNAQARMLVGTGLALLSGSLAAQGYVTGSGPSDPKEAAMWQLAGNQAHSVRIGDFWYQINKLGPYGVLTGIAADLYDVAHEASDGDMLKAAMHLQHAFTQNILDESFMKGPADLIKAVDDPGRYGENYIKSFASSFTPFSSGFYQVNRMMDPYQRETRSVVDAIKAKLPGLSETLMPRRDVWGQPMPSREGAGYLTSIYVQKMNEDPVNRAMLEAQFFPGQVEKKIRNIELTPEEHDDFAKVAGVMTKQNLDRLVTSPNWDTLPMGSKQLAIKHIVEACRETARGIIMARYPHIPLEAAQQKAETMTTGRKR